MSVTSRFLIMEVGWIKVVSWVPWFLVGSRLAALFFMVPDLLFMVIMVPGWFFMVLGWFP